MNKKFSTLVACLLAATSVGTVSAQYAQYTAAPTTQSTVVNSYGYVQLTTAAAQGSGYVLAMIESGGTYSLQMVKAAANVDLKNTLWSVVETPNANDGSLYSFVNLGTGMTLSYDTKDAIKVDDGTGLPTTGIVATKIGGSASQWRWAKTLTPSSGSVTATEMYSAFGAQRDSMLVMVTNNTLSGNSEPVGAVKFSKNNTAATSGLVVLPYDVAPFALTADDVNSMLWKQDKSGKTKFTFTPDVTGNPMPENLFAKEYKAVAAVGYPANAYQVAAPGTTTALAYTAKKALVNVQVQSDFADEILAIMKAAGTDNAKVQSNITIIEEFTKKFDASNITDLAGIEAIANTDVTPAGMALENKVKSAVIKAVKANAAHTGSVVAAMQVVVDATTGGAMTGGTLYDILNGQTTIAGIETEVKTVNDAVTAQMVKAASDEEIANRGKLATNGWISLRATEDASNSANNTYLALDTTYLTNNIDQKFAVKKFIDVAKQSNGAAFAYDNAVRADINGRFNFQFVYHPASDSIVIRTAGFVSTNDISGTEFTPVWRDRDAAKLAAIVPDETPAQNNAVAEASHVERNLVKLARLTADHRELTVGSTNFYADQQLPYSINTRISLNGTSNLVKTTLPSGVYFFNLNTALPSRKDLNGKFTVANYCGEKMEYVNEEITQLFGTAQDFGHMPRTQWVVEQNDGLAGTQTVNITNREYPNIKATNVQLYAAGDDVFTLFTNNSYAIALKDTLSPSLVNVERPNAGALVNEYLGYKRLEAEVLGEKIFNLDYLSGIKLGNFVNVSTTASDTTVYVDVKGEKVFVELVEAPTNAKNKYGYASTKAKAQQLYRTAYLLRVHDASKLVNDSKYIVADPKNENTYSVTKIDEGKELDAVLNGKVSVFFLKENNQLVSESDTTCYYALQEAQYSLVDNTTDKYEYVDAANQRVGVRDASMKFTIEPTCSNNSEVRIATFALVEDNSPLYRRLGVSKEDDGFADLKTDTAKIYRVNATSREYLYEDAYSVYSKEKGINFLGVEGKGDAAKAALYIDTAYVRNKTNMPQYMIAVGVNVVPAGMMCPENPEHNDPAFIEKFGDCGHKVPTEGYKTGRYLINAEDSVQLASNGKDYIWNNKYTRLAFVEAKHIADTLVIYRDGKPSTLAADSIFLGDNKHNMATLGTALKDCKTKGDSIHAAHKYGIKNAVFAFRLVNDDACDFLIESAGNHKLPSDNTGKWVAVKNGVPVVAAYSTYSDAILDAEIFNIEKTAETPTANEGISTSEVSVVAGNGKIIIKGAQGKTVAISNVLGQTIANTVLSSDNAEITAPAGVVVVAVEGEAAVKAIVK